MDARVSLQDRFAPQLVCFGCGPANRLGLQLKSFAPEVGGSGAQQNEPNMVESNCAIEKVTATFTPAAHHVAFEGIVNGGIISTLLDCHLNWTAAWHLMQKNGLATPPCCVTAKYEVTFKAPTPIGVPLYLEAWVVESSERKAIVQGTIAAGKTNVPAIATAGAEWALEATATGLGTFVAVKPGHPAFHRW